MHNGVKIEADLHTTIVPTELMGRVAMALEMKVIGYINKSTAQ